MNQTNEETNESNSEIKVNFHSEIPHRIQDEHMVETFSPQGKQALFQIGDTDKTARYPVLFFAHLEKKTGLGMAHSRVVGLIAKNGIEVCEDDPKFAFYV